MAIDTHSHLFDEAFDTDRDSVIERIKAAKIKKLMIVGFSEETNEKAQELAKKYSFMYPTAGLHPDQVDQLKEDSLEKLEMFIQKNLVYAIGECGLDYYWVSDNKDKQKWLFEEQIKLAIKYNLPIIIHSRDAIQDTYDLLKKYQGKLTFIMHCYSGSLEMAKEFLKLGGYIALGGAVTFKNAITPKEVAKMVPLDRLLVETDCPYMTPVPFRGKRNESSYVRYVIQEIANLREMDPGELEAILDRNSEYIFHIED